MIVEISSYHVEMIDIKSTLECGVHIILRTTQ
jgi:hypothetical protein